MYDREDKTSLSYILIERYTFSKRKGQNYD